MLQVTTISFNFIGIQFHHIRNEEAINAPRTTASEAPTLFPDPTNETTGLGGAAVAGGGDGGGAGVPATTVTVGV